MNLSSCLTICCAILSCTASGFAETPEETLARFKSNGGSCCQSGTHTALAVGRERWTAGNEGLSVLLNPLPKSISVYNVWPIDGQPLTKKGLSLVATAQPTRIIRFYKNSLTDEGLGHFVDELNAHGNRHLHLQFSYLPLTDAGIEHLTRLKKIDYLKISHIEVSAAALKRLTAAFPKGVVEYVPQKKIATKSSNPN